MGRRVNTGLMAIGLTLAGCATTTEVSPNPTGLDPLITEAPAPIPETTLGTIALDTSTSTSSPETTTTTVVPEVINPCVIIIQKGDTVSKIALTASQPSGEPVSDQQLKAENNLASVNHIEIGDHFDICVNGINDITGETLATTTTTIEATTTIPLETTTVPPPVDTTPAIDPATLPTGVAAQQTKLNQLFLGLGMPELVVDDSSGPRTEQQLCAARVALGLPISRADMVPGSPEEQALMFAQSLPIPSTAATDDDRWVVIDQICQVQFLGESSQRLAYVFPTSTGKADYPTRNGVTQAHRYDPATLNGGWHDSTDFPATDDNPLNGNMYKPVYFSKGQAIHGANDVPLEPASHGCARLAIENQEQFITWLGLQDVVDETWNVNVINLTVTVQGDYYEQAAYS